MNYKTTDLIASCTYLLVLPTYSLFFQKRKPVSIVSINLDVQFAT